MTTVLSLLFMIYLFARPVIALQCYSCNNVESNTVCNQKTPQNCTGSQDRCMISKVTTEIFGQQITTLKKGCIESSKCTGTISVIFISAGTECCETDLCNVNGSATFSESKLMLIASASFLYIILKFVN
ncbi:prostate stem cell antigen-like [Carcharodon carcharias]|uniref:prostate stem cell antigen-like n=1 Tax=Carcharodon carcharias TaxID=13397 RepID=UPI001B7E2298|nr:prostate stem cell antigen-like [Carcharodon carcharias]